MIRFILFLLIITFSNSLSVPFKAEGQIRVEETPVEAFGRSDANNDGKLDFQEFLHTDALFEALKLDEFKQLDANNKCVDESPLCPRLEALCDNFFLIQWKEMRCACPKTCKLCNENVNELTTPIPPLAMEAAPTRCDPVSSPIDVVLILDGSSSITKRLFDQQILGFAKNFARKLNISPNGHRLAVVQYSSRARTEIQLGDYDDSGLLGAAIDKIIYMGGGTWTGAAINHAKDRVFDFTRSASKTCIVLTDGVSADRVQGPADQLRQMGVHMIAIGVGPDFNRAELEQIAGEPSHVYTVDNFQNLNNTLAQNLNEKICQDAIQSS